MRFKLTQSYFSVDKRHDPPSIQHTYLEVKLTFRTSEL